MEKKMSLAEIKAMFGDNCFETETSFGVNLYGKYKPGMTFIIPKTLPLGKDGKPINPIFYEEDKEVTGNMNLDFDGEPTFMFGDFWRSKKGNPCFRPKSPLHAKHLLIRVRWGGCFNRSRGNYEAPENAGVIFFKRASSNGGGAGCDYWVVSVGYRRYNFDPEIDGDERPDHSDDFEQNAKAYRKKYADLQRQRVEEADKFLREKFAAEEESKANRARYMPRLEEIQAELIELGKPQASGQVYHLAPIDFGEIQVTIDYFKRFYYGEAALEAAEKFLEDSRSRIARDEDLLRQKAECAATWEPRFEEFRDEIESYGWTIEFNSKDGRAYINGHGYSYSEAGIEALKESLQKEAERLAAEKAQQEKLAREAEAKAMGLPSNVRLWHRIGKTNAGKAWVIQPNGMERECDFVDTMVCGSNSKKYHQDYEGDHVWNQILPGELVIYWSHAYTAAPHNCEVIYCPESLTEAQKERVAEIQQNIEANYFGAAGLTGTNTCPSIGDGWGLF